MKYDSNIATKPLEINAPYYNAILDTTIFFEQEKISLFINSLGHIVFSSESGDVLGSLDLPVHKDPSEYGHTAQYGQVKCTADGQNITIYLPIYYWEDSYPHCDGESDRWSRYVSRWFRVVFHCNTHQITILEE